MTNQKKMQKISKITNNHNKGAKNTLSTFIMIIKSKNINISKKLLLL